MLDLSLLENNPNTPSFYATLITVLFAFFLSSLITITYQLTTKSIYRNAHFLQGLALISIVAATVMQAIGDSLARGLGMLGALAIIRFRTVLNDPRNISFMFASLAAGIACGVFGFSIALTGTIIFCLAAILIRFSPLSNPNELIGNLKLRVPKDEQQQSIIENHLRAHCKNFELNQLRFINPKKVETIADDGISTVEEITRQSLQEFTYLIRMKSSSTTSSLTNTLKEMDGLVGLRLNFKKQPTNL